MESTHTQTKAAQADASFPLNSNSLPKYEALCNILFHCCEWSSRPTTTMQDYPLSTVSHCLFPALLHFWSHIQGRIKLFGAPRQWKHFRPLFQAVFLSGGGYYPCPPDWVKHHASQSQERSNKYFILYIEFVAADLLFRLARMRHAWKGDYLTVLVFSWQILFLLA